MITLKDIREHMLDYLPEYDFTEDLEDYDDDGHCDGLYNDIRRYWEDFSTDKDFIYVLSAKWFGERIDLNGGRDCILERSDVIPMLFDYMVNTLGWNLEDYENNLSNSNGISDKIQYMFLHNGKEYSVKEEKKIDKKSKNIWENFNFKTEDKPKITAVEKSKIETEQTLVLLTIKDIRKIVSKYADQHITIDDIIEEIETEYKDNIVKIKI